MEEKELNFISTESIESLILELTKIREMFMESTLVTVSVTDLESSKTKSVPMELNTFNAINQHYKKRENFKFLNIYFLEDQQAIHGLTKLLATTKKSFNSLFYLL